MNEVAAGWLEARVVSASTGSLRGLIEEIARLVATASGEAVSVRWLRPGGELVALAASHPDPSRSAAMTAVMTRTESSSQGLWARVITDGEPVRWAASTATSNPSATPSATQTAFIESWSVGAVIGVPLLAGDRVVGGLAAVRFGSDRPFEDRDEDLLLAVAPRLGAIVAALGVVVDASSLREDARGEARTGERGTKVPGAPGPVGSE